MRPSATTVKPHTVQVATADLTRVFWVGGRQGLCSEKPTIPAVKKLTARASGGDAQTGWGL